MTQVLKTQRHTTYHFRIGFSMLRTKFIFRQAFRKRIQTFQQASFKTLQIDRPLINIVKNDSKLNYKTEVKVSNFGKSLCGLNIPLITIQRNSSHEKNYIIISARTHAGQTSSSWVMDGFIQHVTSSPQLLQWICQRNISLKIVPMLNPDGVFVGNYRTGIIGDDFNRKFLSAKKQMFPEIFLLKKLVSQCKRSGKLFMFLDLHGHSILKNSFIYGPVQSLFTTNPLRNLPIALWHSSKYFRLSSCKFRFQKDLTETARVYFQLKESVLTYTCQTSLGLYNNASSTVQMLEKDYKALGASIIQSIAQLMTAKRIQQFQYVQTGYSQVRQITPKIRQYQSANKASAMPQIRNKTYIREKIKSTKNETPSQQSRKKINFFNKNRKQIHSEDMNLTLQARKDEQILEKLQITQNIPNSAHKSSIRSSVYNSKTSKANWMLEQKLNYSISTRKKKPKANNETPKTKSNLNSMILYDRELTESKKLKQTQNAKGWQDEQDIIQNNQSNKLSNFNESSNAQTHKNKNETKTADKKQIQFKVRKRSDIIRVLPESYRKKLGSKLRLNIKASKYLQQDFEQTSFGRSATEDAYHLSRQIELIQKEQQRDNIRKSNKEINQNEEQSQLQIINERFSQQYESINDEDDSSDDLGQKQKLYLLECLRNNLRIKTNNNQFSEDDQSESQTNPNQNATYTNINRFKQIQFKSVENRHKVVQPIRPSKRDPNKFKQLNHNHKSLSRNIGNTDQELVSHMVQKKHLNERQQRKTQRQPYFLVQLKKVG